jgi:hypothetical protein
MRSRVDSDNVVEQDPPVASPQRSAPEPGEGAVASSAARILAKADRAVEEVHAEVVRIHRATESLHVEMAAELRSDRATIAGISSDLESVHSQFAQINSGILGLQNNSLRQTGVGALAPAVLIAIAWKVIGG